MAPKTKINLKERLEDGELDLSLSDLQEVPVREIALMKKATSLDLSNNRLTLLGKNFATITHIIKLDLSKNLLTELPEDFGELKQLKHLDLYSNNLTHLPLSFHQLKALRWLDLKNNPLIPALAKVAGPCLDAPQCTQCARSVVTFFTQMNEQVEEEKARRELQRQAELEAEASQQKQVQKKKEKKKAKKEKKGKGKPEKGQETVQPVAVENLSCVRKPTQKKKPSKTSKSNLCVSLFKLLFFSLLMSSISLFVFSTLKIHCATVFKQKAIDTWGEALKSVPSDYKPWADKLEGHVQNLHSMTGRVVDNVVVFADELRKDERVNATIQVLWDTLIVVGTKSKKMLVGLGDQAVIWTNEIKKSLKL